MNRLIKSMWRLWTESGFIPEDKTITNTETSALEPEEDYRVVVVAWEGFALTVKEPLNLTKKSEGL